MNAPAEIDPSFLDVHRAAVHDANAWRGRCVNLFARGERVVTEALAAESPGKLPPLLGQKLEKLAKSGAGQPAVLKAIIAFQELTELRNIVVHCETQVYSDAKGRWLLEFRDCVGKITRRLSDCEANDLCRQVQSAVDRLDNRLNLNSRTPGPAGTPCA